MSSWFSVALGALFAGSSAWGLGRGLLTLRWPAASGRVLETGARHRRGRRSRYVPAVRYEYEVGAQQFEGAWLGFGWQVLRASEASGRKELGTLAPRAEVVIYYNPRRPCDAVLLRGVTLGTLWFLAAGVFFITAGLNF